MLQSRSQRFFSFVLKASLGVVAIFGGVYYARWLMTVDPFQRYRQTKQGRLGENIAMRLEDVRMWTYDGGKLVAKAFVKRVDIQSDRQNLQLTGITDGVMIGKEGRFNFTANKAYYKAFQGVLTVQEGARISNKDMNLTLEGFTYSEQAARLRSVGAIRGLLRGGNIQAVDLEYSTDSGDYSTGPISWIGESASPFEMEFQGNAGATEQPKQQKSKWKFKADSSKHVGDVTTHKNARATDDEVIVKAPIVEFNEKTDVLTATGRVEYFSPDANLICDKAVIYRKEKRAVLTGNVTMLIKPKAKSKLEEVELKPFTPIVPESIKASNPTPPKEEEQSSSSDSKGIRQYPVTVFAERIEYWYGKGSRRANITGRPQARQDLPDGEWRHVWCTQAFYDGEAETLKLESEANKKTVRIRSAAGDDAVASWFKITTKEEDEDNWEGEGVEGDFVTKDEIPKRGGGSTGGGGGGEQKPPLKGGIGGNRPTKGGR